MEFRTSRGRAASARAPSARRSLRLLDGARAQSAPTVLATAYRHRDFWTRRLLVIGDAFALLLALLVSEPFGKSVNVPEHVLWGFVVLPVWIILYSAYGLYERDAKRVSHTTVDDIPWVFHAVLVGVLLLWVFYKFVAGEQLILAEIAVLSAGVFAATLLLRFAIRAATTRMLRCDRVLLVGEDAMTDVLVRKMRAHQEYGLDPIGVITPSGTNGASSLPPLGSLDDLSQAAVENGVDRILVSSAAIDQTEQLDVLRRCRELSLKVGFVPEVFDVMGPSVAVDDVEGITVLGINPPVLSRTSRMMKRGLDFVASSVLLLLLFPLLLVIAVAIKLDSRGPVFFKQRRIGRAGKPFTLLKFRTMCEDAEKQQEELRKFSKDPHWLLIEDDPRLTRIGRYLRVASLDELPQLWNVIRGEMSLVGPRPLAEAEDKRVGGWARSRLELTPGITGSWQVLGRTTIPFEEMVKLDYVYVVNWSLWNDIRLMLRTLPVVLKRSGAN